MFFIVAFAVLLGLLCGIFGTLFFLEWLSWYSPANGNEADRDIEPIP